MKLDPRTEIQSDFRIGSQEIAVLAVLDRVSSDCVADTWVVKQYNVGPQMLTGETAEEL